MEEGLTIRPARPDEADAIHALTQAAYREYHTDPAPSLALQETAREVRERMWRGEFKVAVAERDGAMVGSARYKLNAGGLYFFRVAVHPEWRRQGVAHALLAWLEDEARRSHVHRIWCQVRLIVPRNVGLYRSLGYEITEEHVVVRSGREVPTATMEKRLTEENREPAALIGVAAAALGEGQTG